MLFFFLATFCHGRHDLDDIDSLRGAVGEPLGDQLAGPATRGDAGNPSPALTLLFPMESLRSWPLLPPSEAFLGRKLSWGSLGVIPPKKLRAMYFSLIHASFSSLRTILESVTFF